MIAGIEGRESLRLRADIYWASRQWQKAAEHIFARLKTETAEVFAKRPLGLTLEIVEIDPVGSLKHNNLHEIVAARSKGAA